jgi:hypothetical protein
MRDDRRTGPLTPGIGVQSRSDTSGRRRGALSQGVAIGTGQRGRRG